MTKKRWVALITIFTLLVTLLTLAKLNVSQDGSYEKTFKNNSYNSGELVNVEDIRDGIISLSINGSSALLKEGETYEIRSQKSEYSGTIEIVKINQDDATIKVDAEKTIHFYIFNGSLIILVSLLISMLIAWKPTIKNPGQ